MPLLIGQNVDKWLVLQKGKLFLAMDYLLFLGEASDSKG